MLMIVIAIAIIMCITSILHKNLCISGYDSNNCPKELSCDKRALIICRFLWEYKDYENFSLGISKITINEWVRLLRKRIDRKLVKHAEHK